MPVQRGIFYENQQGGKCRLHVMNAFCGRPTLTAEHYQEYMEAFDEQMSRRYGEKTSCADFDLVHSDQNNLISYILKKNGFYARYAPINSFYKKQLKIDDLKGDFIFVFSDSHIWGIKRKGGAWFKVDSIGGVTPIKSAKNYLSSTPNIGCMVPVDMRAELNFRVDAIAKILGPKVNVAKIKTHLQGLNKKKQILEDLEIHMGVAIDILDAQSSKLDFVPAFVPIYNIINLYEQFLVDFVAKNYHMSVIEVYVPQILYTLLVLVKGRGATDEEDDDDQFIR